MYRSTKVLAIFSQSQRLSLLEEDILMMSRPAQSNNTDKAVLLWDEGHVYRWENDKNESLTPIASLEELPAVSQILQLDTDEIIVLSALSDTITYVHLHSQTA